MKFTDNKVALDTTMTKVPEQVVEQYLLEDVELNSKGKCYPEDNPLSIGTIQMRYMTAADEDILTNQNFIQKNTVLDKLLQALIVSDINIDDLVLGDKDGLLLAARIFAYGKLYQPEIECPNCKRKTTLDVDLTQFNSKEIDFELLNRDNVYKFELPQCKKEIKFKLLTSGDDKQIEEEIKRSKKVGIPTNETIIGLKHIIISIDGITEKQSITKQLNTILATDIRSLRQYIQTINPGVDLNLDFECSDCGFESRISLPMKVQFFWPDARI
ncbi:MAG: hypothetical protein M0R17_08695 [Candidatus Omnitrophica bacterium]|jgi:hypothetical protein|nr:hypothetical protein [Candidatus Omnitrophota bacterium]